MLQNLYVLLIHVVFDFNVNGEETNITKAVIMHGDTAGDYIHVIMPMNY